MAQDLEQQLKELFGGPLSRLSRFEEEQMTRLRSKVKEIAREAVKEDLTRLQSEITDLRNRVATLEAERVQASADQV